MNANLKVTVALLVGLAAGTGLGMLFAPDAGDETRSRINGSFKNLGESIKEVTATEIERLISFKDRLVDNIKTRLNGEEVEYQDDLEHA